MISMAIGGTAETQPHPTLKSDRSSHLPAALPNLGRSSRVTTAVLYRVPECSLCGSGFGGGGRVLLTGKDDQSRADVSPDCRV